MLANALFSLTAFAIQGLAIPTSGNSLQARQGYTSNCTATYDVVQGDTCDGIINKYNDTFSLADLYSWNPEIDSNCANLFVGEVICVQVNNMTGTVPACPVPAMQNTISTCDECYLVKEGDSCTSIEAKYGVTLSELVAWNPSINTGCTALEIGYNYCVGVSS
ncbi:hypothetical protein F5Y16DRAFT_372662 [Xylariaceae sp. FL0255]|nr:hypothetical protein F5Y16DRAFT_372662 [Xylariaceae sp. FL0255]